MQGLTWYLAGPMSGIAQFNIPLFDRAAARLRKEGIIIVSPAELDDPEVRAASLASVDGKPIGIGGTWGDFLARDVKVVSDTCDGVILLQNWSQSRGARLEAFVGLLTDKTFARYVETDSIPGWAAFKFDSDQVRSTIRDKMP